MYADKMKSNGYYLKVESPLKIYIRNQVSRTTVIDLINKTSSIDKMRFDNAVKLTKMAKMRKTYMKTNNKKPMLIQKYWFLIAF